jgi:hypothetical protein
MAPELFSGGAAATQTDVYSVGVLLFRLVTGAFPLPARSLAEVRLGHEQNRASGSATSARICPRRSSASSSGAWPRSGPRYASAGELELALTGFLATRRSCRRHRQQVRAATPRRPPRRARRRADSGDVAIAARPAAGRDAGVGAAAGWPARGRGCRRAGRPPTVRFMITPPGNEDFLSFSLAPDGSQVAFGAEGKLWTRPLGSVEARPVRRLAGRARSVLVARQPSIAYFKQNALWWPASAAASRATCVRRGTRWAARGAPTGRFSSPPTSAAPSTASRRPAASACAIRLQGEHGTDLRWPSFVPGTSAFIYSSRRAPSSRA